MIVEASQASESDLRSILGLLEVQTLAMPQPLQAIAALMVHEYERDQEFPPVRAIALAAHSSLGAAERGRKAVLLAFRRHLIALHIVPQLRQLL